MAGIMKMVPVFCGRDCGGDACPLLAELEGGRVVGIRHNPAAGSYIRGCPKGFALPHFHYSPERIRDPLLRVGPRGSGRFKAISWSEALRLVRERLTSTIERFGNEAVLCLSSAGSTGALHNTEVLSKRFLNAIGGCTLLEGSYSSNAANHALKKVFGQDYYDSGFDPATMEEAGLIILWGANIVEARLGSEFPARLLQARKRGVPVISIDPRKTSSAIAGGAEWIAVRPGTDVALMYAVLFVLDRDSLLDIDRVGKRAEGFSEILDHVRGTVDRIEKSPLWASAICGVDKRKIESLARRWASEKPTMLIPGYSIQRTSSGEEVMRLCVALQLATGNFGKLGGSTGSINNRLPRLKTGKMTEGKGENNPRVPVLRWADAVLKGRPEYPSSVRAVYSAGGNFLNQGADLKKNVQAFNALDFSVSHELFMTPTARYCDIVLPVASPLQKEDIGLPWAGNYVLYKPKILPYEGQERSDYDIFRELSSGFGVEGAFSGGRSESQWIDFFLGESEIPNLEDFRAKGIYLGKEQKRSGLSDFAESPELYPLRTPSGKLELEGSRWTAQRQPPEFSFLLVTPKAAKRVHSQGGDHPEEIRRNRLQVNASDAELLEMKSGDKVRIVSGNGSACVEIEASDRIMRGVVSLYEGTWFGNPESVDDLSGSANVLTSTLGTKESTSCIMHGIPVRLEPARPRGNL